jgi:hypothetical protein
MRTAVIALLVVVGCGASATRVMGPDGSVSWYEITCLSNHGSCLEKARELCPNGYEVATSDGRTERIVSDAMVGEPESGKMLTRCR